MTERPPSLTTSDRYHGLCVCGEHAWAVLTRGYVTFVSPKDAHHLERRKWYAQENARRTLVYAAAGSRGLHVLLHRQILGDAAGAETDHRDGVGLNNRRNNLRPCSRRENRGNSRHQSGVSGFRGVHFVKTTGYWVAFISPRRYLGTYSTAEEAARAYDAAAIECFGVEFATLNFPHLRPGSLSLSRRRKLSQSGFRGVSRERSGRWRALISDRRLGTFATPEQAARAYDAAALVRYGEFATLNSPAAECARARGAPATAGRAPPATSEMSRNFECLKLRIKCSPAHWTIPSQAKPTKGKGTPIMAKFNEFQKAAIRAYHNDEAKGLLENDDEVDTQNISVGDSLLTFIIRELDEHMDIEEAIRRMETARADVEAVLHALTKGAPQGGSDFALRLKASTSTKRS